MGDIFSDVYKATLSSAEILKIDLNIPVVFTFICLYPALFVFAVIGVLIKWIKKN